MSAKFGCVVLTQGKRPHDLGLALDSLHAQEGVDLDIAVVGNAWEPSGLPPWVHGVHLEINQGIPAGRNRGVPHTEGDYIFFLDDDASLAQPDALAHVAELFETQPDVGLVQLRVDAREGGGHGPRDWVPRLGAKDRDRPGDVTVAWEGAVAMQRKVFEEIDGWPEEFIFVHEGADLAWRVMDAGYRVYYMGDRSVLHPLPAPVAARHGYSRYYGARNRVWMARRHLPFPLGVLFVATFAVRTLPLLLRSPRDIPGALRGYRDGMRGPCGRRRKLHWSTIVRMTRAGRPPIL